jgi:isoprenylcysteine carboxyl methyltransferase (ICMT) family protein YpbQ
VLTHNDRGRALLDQGAGSFGGLAVSEYTILSTVSLFSNDRRVVGLELAVLALVLALEIVLFARYRIGLLAFIGRPVIAVVRRSPQRLRRGLSDAFWWLLSVPASWFIGQFAVALLGRVKPLHTLGRHVPPEAAWAVSALVLNAWLLLAIWRSQPLPLWVWGKLSYRPPRLLVRFARHPGVYRAVVWFLHLPVFYAFAFALVGFLAADINVALTFMIPEDTKLSLPGATLSQPETLVSWLRATLGNLGVLLDTGPAALTFEQATAVIRFFIYAGAITGCMIGYLHSVLKVLSWSSIRNVDFTILGWLTAMLCYGPLLGHVLWSVIEFPLSLVPAITQGPLLYAMLVLELLLNVLYSLSLYNMFTKFGVLVDKGLVDTGFYSFLRHPSYTLEAFMLIMVYARMLQTGSAWFGILVLVLLYWLRSEREDVFMAGSNPEYREYRRRVTCKFIPGLV